MQAFQPRLTALVPDRWVAKESIQMLAPDYRANVIASGEPLGSDMDLDAYAEAQGRLLKEFFPGYTEHELRSAKMFGGRDVLLRRFEWTAPPDVRVAQIQVYFVEAGRGFTATATVEEKRLEDFQSSLTEILAGLELTGVALTAPGPRRGFPDDPREQAYELLERGELVPDPSRIAPAAADGTGDEKGNGKWGAPAEAWRRAGARYRP